MFAGLGGTVEGAQKDTKSKIIEELLANNSSANSGKKPKNTANAKVVWHVPYVHDYNDDDYDYEADPEYLELLEWVDKHPVQTRTEQRGWQEQPREKNGQWGSNGRHLTNGANDDTIRKDMNGIPFNYPTVYVPPVEYAHFTEEVGTYYDNYKGDEFTHFQSAIFGKIYFFENRGIGDYNIYRVVEV